ncbi:MAG: hypothetical protein MK101_08370 [Phycisphaerales bacterium]|nr:hypothetical protein [Phycisphaerales bacterium]
MSVVSLRCTLAALCSGVLCTYATAQVRPAKPLQPARVVPATPITPGQGGPGGGPQLPDAVILPPGVTGPIEMPPGGPQEMGLQPPQETKSAPISGMNEAEAARIIAIYNALEPDAQEAMRELYLTQDIDLLMVIARMNGADAKPLMPSFSRKKFKRTPQAVLAARTKLGLESFRPAETAEPRELVEWLHLNVMAGEWGELQWFLNERAGAEAPAMYSHVLQSTNQGDPMLLPEEVLALANAAPEGTEEVDSPTDWQIDILGSMLKQSAQRASVGPMLEQLHAGTRLFGGEIPAHQARTAALLTRAGMPQEAHRYLPDLDAARTDQNGRALLIHGLYHADLDEVVPAWSLFGEVALLSDADFKLRQEALREAVKRLPEVPETQATQWLMQVFADDRLAPAALEVIALDAMNLSKRGLSVTARARTILVMKAAVESLLASGQVDSDTIRVPLRMLTTGLVMEAEKIAEARTTPNRVPREITLMMRALPDESWLQSIEPSLASRAYRAFIQVALRADETDIALDILQRGVASHAADAQVMGQEFLDGWIKRLRPDAGSNRTAAAQAMLMLYGGDMSMTAAPLTRGRQARNIARLVEVLDLLKAHDVDPQDVPNLVSAFRACHSRSEAYSEPSIEEVFGPISELPAPVASKLAAAMQAGLSGDWRSREVQQRFGMRRNAVEIAAVVEEGYALAARLIEQARSLEPDTWQHAIARAALAYERLEHRRAQAGEELADYEQLREQSFNAFRDAAVAYADAAARGEVDPTADVFSVWFNAAVGATDLSTVTRDNVLYEGSERDTQINTIRETILAMPEAAADEHMALLAGELTTAINSLSPEVKPRVVGHALRIVGEHPAGATLRRIQSLYDDLLKNEIHLRLIVDGADRIGADQPFAAVLTLRYTNAVDRETDGFGKYLRNGVYLSMGGRGTSMNYRDRLDRSIRTALSEGFEVEGIGYFDPMHPSREVRENGESGWQEKPLAYIALKATDPSIERVPAVTMDIDFMDQTGPVILPIESNAPLVDAARDSDARPVHDLTVEQIVDVRDDEAVLLEITATGRGMVPQLDQLLSGIDSALPGWRIADGGLETHDIVLLESAESDSDRFFLPGDEDPEQELELVGDDGVHRQATQRRWSVRYVPTASPTGGNFTMPTMVAGINGELANKTFSDMDLVVVEGGTVPLDEGLRLWSWIAIAVALVAIVVALILLQRRSVGGTSDSNETDWMPARDTPLSAIAALERIDQAFGPSMSEDRRTALRDQIQSLQAKFFSPSSEAEPGSLRDIVERWVQEVHATPA